MKHSCVFIIILSVLTASPAVTSDDQYPSADKTRHIGLPFEKNFTAYGSDGDRREYTVDLLRGQVLSVQITDGEKNASGYTVTCFRFPSGPEETVERIQKKTVTGAFLFEPETNGRYCIRLENEELAGGTAILSFAASPILTFPIQGKNNSKLVSLFGDGRDEGARFHEGIDIKAARSTPVLAVTDGIIRRVGQNARGGNVITLWDPVRKLYYYYAHLDTQDIQSGKPVRAGEKIGTVGNSGNASGGYPHLHFTVYTDSWVPIDPVYFIYPVSEAAL